jgi:hypothetical protein
VCESEGRRFERHSHSPFGRLLTWIDGKANRKLEPIL